MNLRAITYQLYHKSPAQNLAALGARLPRQSRAPRNDMLDPLLALRTFPEIAAWRIAKLPGSRVVLLGDAATICSWNLGGRVARKMLVVRDWNWSDGLDSEADAFADSSASETCYVVCRCPHAAGHWQVLAAANARSETPGRVFTLGELVAPFSAIAALREGLRYFLSPDELVPIYLGHEFFGPLRELDAIVPLEGRSVIEFGCFDGGQSLGLCHLGAKLTCFEARAENVAKTRAALDAVGFPDVRIIMDDFHNAHGNRYGRFDLAFAHGVYYHSIAPFVFLENLVSLSDRIFVGGFCATDGLPDTPWMSLEHQGRSYRVKPYTETTGYTAGVNDTGYFFHLDDLQHFFIERDYRVTMISEERSGETAGCFARFMALR